MAWGLTVLVAAPPRWAHLRGYEICHRGVLQKLDQALALKQSMRGAKQSEEKVPLRQWERLSRFAHEQLPVGADFVGLGIDRDLGSGVVPFQILLPIFRQP